MPRSCKAHSEERKAEVKRLILLGHTYQEIADLTGISFWGICTMVRRHKLVSKGCVDLNKSLRLKGKPAAPHKTRTRSAISQERWGNPETRERIIQGQKAYRSTPAGALATKRANDAKRGFPVPDELWDEYQHLIKSKHYKAKEAGVLLGIILTSNDNADRRVAA